MQKKEDENKKPQELEPDDLEDVTGGSFENVPRVPEHKIDDSLRKKI